MVTPATALYPAETVRDRSSFFHTFLADQPEYLVPERLTLNDRNWNPSEPLFINPNVWFTWRDYLPPTVEACYPLPDKFLQDTGLIWVDDPVTGLQRPFWAGPWFQGKLEGAHRGGPAVGFSAHHRRVLFEAGVLIRPDEAPRRSAEWRGTLAEAFRRFQSDDYVRLYELIHPFHLGSLRRYYRHMVRTGGMTLGDSGSPRRCVAYNETVAQFFHGQFAAIVSAIAGVRVRPSFVYVASYQGSAELPVHTDREQCEYAVSLLVDYTPEPLDQSPWPLYLETAKGTVTVWQAIGDALLYRGQSLPHYRTPLAGSSTSTSIFFYYVDDNFDGPLA
jgi:hypothetical protein